MRVSKKILMSMYRKIPYIYSLMFSEERVIEALVGVIRRMHKIDEDEIVTLTIINLESEVDLKDEDNLWLPSFPNME